MNVREVFSPGSLGQRLSVVMETERRYPSLLAPLLFFFLAIVACTWVPFYPWWMVLVISIVIGVISYRFPYLSLILLSVFMCASAAYQTPEFGLVMLLILLVILVVSLFEWKLGYLVLLSVALSRFGLSCPAHDSSFMVFYRPTLEGFAPSDIGTALMSVQDADLGVLSGVIGENLGISILPFLQIIAWGLAVYLVYRFYHKDSQEVASPVVMSFIPPLILAASFFASYYVLLTPGTAGLAAGALLFGTAFVAILIARVGKDYFAPYFASLNIETGVGTRISDMTELGESSFDLIGGLDDVKEDVKESIVVPLLRSDIAEKYGIEPPKGILLFGPPGCGKTLMMKALANELRVEMITIKCSDIMSKWYGESENKVAELFRVAKERRPCIIFFDDLEAMAKHRDMYAGDDVTPRLLSIMLAELDGMDHSSGIILVGTTNKPELIDPALLRPGRFDKIIYVPPPDQAERVAILNVHMAKRPRAQDLDFKVIAAKCERFSGADIANLAREAATLAMRRALTSNMDTVISTEDMMTVATNIKPSISLAMLETYELLKLDFERKMHHVKRDDRASAVSWNDVGGLDRTKKDIKDYIELLVKEPEILDSFRLKSGRGMLLFGPPGCGKKHIMRAAANNLDITIQEINATELVGGNGYGAPSIKDIFYRAREATPSIVMIDDIEVIGSREAIEGADAGRSISQILAEFDNVESKEHILVIATTNRPQMLHPSLLRPGRFDKMFYVPPPVENARKSIFKIYLKNIPLAKDVDSALLDELASRSEGYSSADIAAVVDEAKLIAVINGKAGTKRLLTKENLLSAISRLESSITPEDLESAQNFMKVYKVKK